MHVDQLSYVLQRKYNRSQPGVDYVLAETIIDEKDELGRLKGKGDARIVQWDLDLPQPSEEYLNKLWTVLEEEYHGQPDRENSQMFIFLELRRMKEDPPVTLNEDLP